MRIKSITGRVAGMALLLSLPGQSVFADLDTEINRKILDATKHDASRNKLDKLFKNRCETIAKYIGFADDVTGKARKYSCDNTAVGIAFYAGEDLGKHPPEKIAQLFRKGLAEYNVRARVFIKHDHPHGSSVAFYINGESWQREPVRPSKGYKMIETLAAETNLLLYHRGRIKAWMTDKVSE